MGRNKYKAIVIEEDTGKGVLVEIIERKNADVENIRLLLKSSRKHKVGETVFLGSTRRGILFYAFFIYIIPVLLILTMAFACAAIFRTPQIVTALLTFGTPVLYFFALKFYLQKRPIMKFRIL